MHEKIKFVCFNYMQPQKMKFKSVEMNMRQVSWYIVRVGARMSIPKMSIPKMSIPIMSTVPECLFP